MLTQQDLEGLIGPILLSEYPDRKLNPMSVQELKEALRDIPGSNEITISYAPNGNQILHLGDKQVEIGPMASNDEIRAVLQNPFIPTANTKMSITGANSLKAKFEAAKARKAAIESRVETALTSYNGAADIAESAIKSLEDDAAALQAEVSAFTNGAPA